MLVVGCVGLAVNLAAAWILRGGSRSLNMRGALLHVLADALGSAGVIVAGIVVLTTGWDTIDPLISVAIGVLILLSSWTLLRDSVNVLLEATPSGMSAEEVGRTIVSLDGVVEIHDLHIWTITSGFPRSLRTCSSSLVSTATGFRRQIEVVLRERFELDHTTLQVDHVRYGRCGYRRVRPSRRLEYAPVPLTILEGTTFCICDERGDVGEDTSGFFADDTRFLSVLRLTIDGRRPLLLTSDKVEYFSAAFILRNPPTETLPQDSLSITRSRFVGDAMQDRIVVQNQGTEPVMFQLALEIGSDFADIFTVKAHDFSFGDPLHAPRRCLHSRNRSSTPRRRPVPPCRPRGSRDDAGDPLARPGPGRRRSGRLSVELAPRERWELASTSCPRRRRGIAPRPRGAPVRRGAPAHPRLADGLAAARAAAALRMGRPRARRLAVGGRPRRSQDSRQGERRRNGGRPAAGMPWFMTVFGRTRSSRASRRCCSARSSPAVRSRSSPSSRRPKTTRRSTPSRGRSCTRCAAARRRRIVVRALLRHRRRDAALPRPPLGGLALDGRRSSSTRCESRPSGARVDRPLRRPRRGRLRRVREAKPARARQPVVEGLVRLAALPRRDGPRTRRSHRARCRATSSTRSSAWPRSRERSGATGRSPIGSTARRRSYGERSTRRSGSRSAVATTRSRSTATSSRVDSMCSNMGHLLWSGIVPAERADAVVDQLMGDALWSGWGVRTMSADESAYNPLSYHNGTVWPHDNSLIAWVSRAMAGGPRRSGSSSACSRRRRHLDHQLPEVFAGMPRYGDPVSDRLPDGRAPAGMGCGTPVLLLQVLLGLQPDRASGTRSRPSRRASCRRGRVAPSLRRQRFGRHWTMRVDEDA